MKFGKILLNRWVLYDLKWLELETKRPLDITRDEKYACPQPVLASQLNRF